MSLIPWSSREPNPVPRIRSLEDEFANLFRSIPSFGTFAALHEYAFTPAVNVRDTEKHIVVTADLPGVDKNDIKIDVNGDTVMIRGEKKEARTEDSDNWWRRESSYGRFMRRITLPMEVDADRAEARMQHGILEIMLPKATASNAKAISIG